MTVIIDHAVELIKSINVYSRRSFVGRCAVDFDEAAKEAARN